MDELTAVVALVYGLGIMLVVWDIYRRACATEKRGTPHVDRDSVTEVGVLILDFLRRYKESLSRDSGTGSGARSAH